MKYELKNLLLTPVNLLYKLSPEAAIKTIFFIKHGYRLNLKNPVTFNEKLNWIKLYYRHDLMPICVDKYTVRQYVKECGCGDLLNELYWEGYDPEEIPFDDLPKQFVIKVTHGSGFNIICKDKEKLDRKETVRTLKKWLKTKYLPSYGEWFYGIVKPRVIVEKYLDDEKNYVPNDYKIFCFHGEPKYVVVDTDRFSGHKRNIYDTDWNLMPARYAAFPLAGPVERPALLNDMLEAARKLSGNFIQARIDLYIVNNRIYFGEITFMDGSGFNKIIPYSFDVEMGSHLKLPIQQG